MSPSRPATTFSAVVVLLALILCSNAESQIKFEKPIDSIFIKGRDYNFRLLNTANQKVRISYSPDNGLNKKIVYPDTAISTFKWGIPVIREKDLRLYAESEYYTNPVLLWEQLKAHNSEIRSSEFSLDGKLILTASKDPVLKIWEIASRKAIDSIEVTDRLELFSACFGKDNNTIFFSADSLIYVWDRVNKIAKQIGDSHFERLVRRIKYNRAQNLIGACSYDGKAVVCGEDGIVKYKFSAEVKGELYGCAFDNAGTQFAYAGYEGIIEVRNLNDTSRKKSFIGHGDLNSNKLIWGLDFSSDGSLLSSCGNDATVRLWDMFSGKQLIVFDSHIFHVRDVKFVPNNLIISGSLDNTLRFNSIANKSALPVYIDNKAQIICLDAVASGDSLITAGRDNSFRVWRNVEYFYSSDSLDIPAKFLVTAYFNNTEMTAGVQSNIPLLAKHTYPDSLIEGFRFYADAAVKMPYKYLQVLNHYVPPALKGDYTIEFNVRNDVYKDTLTVFKAIGLLGPTGNAKLKVTEMTCEKEGYFTAELEDGDLETNRDCRLQNGQGIVAGEFPGIFDVTESKSKLTANFIPIDNSELTIELVSLSGNVILRYKIKPANTNLQTFELDTSNLADGMFLIRIYNQSYFISKKVLIIR